MNKGMSCVRPPAGWWCSRKGEHSGPCAARLVVTHGQPQDPRTLDELFGPDLSTEHGFKLGED